MSMCHLLAVVALAALAFAQTDYGSYIALCDSTSTEVTFVNYPHQGCQGTPSNYSKPLNICEPELVFASWNAKCNSTNIVYSNFVGTKCEGDSIVTRTYFVRKCFNCPNAQCKS